jgi:hypothetical protein
MVVYDVFRDYLGTIYMYADMDNNQCTEMQHKFHHSLNPAVFISIHDEGGKCHHSIAANHT